MPRGLRAAFFLVLSLTAASAPAQTTSPDAGDTPPPVAPASAGDRALGIRFTLGALQDLPLASSIFSLLDMGVPEVTSDRVDGGGLWAGQAPRIGAHGSSWTQTSYRLGDADITDPIGNGTPLLLPGVYTWATVDVSTGLLPINVNAAGTAVLLQPRRPSQTWIRQVDVFGSSPALLSRDTITDPPAIARQHNRTDGSLLLSGPLVPDRVGLVLAGSWTHSSRFERADPTEVKSSVGSGFMHLLFTPQPRDELHVIGWADRAEVPAENRVAFAEPLATEHQHALHVQSSWEHRNVSPSSWTLFGQFTSATRTSDLRSSGAIVIERLRDGPVANLLSPIGTDRTWALGVRLNRRNPLQVRESGARAGIELSGGSAQVQAPFGGSIGELVDGVPARVWTYSTPTARSEWSKTTFAAYAGDSVPLLGRVTLDLGVRFEAVGADATQNPIGISWRNWFPRAGIQWDITERGHFTAFSGFGRYGYQLPLSALAFGDESAPVAKVYRWNTTLANPAINSLGPLVARVGPGAGGLPGFSSINPDLDRPYTDEFAAGIESRPLRSTVIRLTAIARRERRLLGIENVGVSESSYSIVTVLDEGVDVVHRTDDQNLPIYNRAPATFAADQYLLTNPAGSEATFVGVAMTGRTELKHLFLIAGATAGRSEGYSGNIGFGALENDQGVLGDVFSNPNARDHAQGRLFTERGYTVKTAGVYHFAHDVTLGIAARYQDGQHFARLVVAPDLNQGAEVVRAFRNGRTRFTYTLTVDTRLQKGFSVGRGRVAIVFDAYNLLNRAKEVEEYTTTSELYRVTAAVQPPRALHLGLRMNF